MTNDNPSGFSHHFVDTSDIPAQLANVNYRLDIIITILLFALCIGLVSGVVYLIYRFLLRFM